MRRSPHLQPGLFPEHISPHYAYSREIEAFYYVHLYLLRVSVGRTARCFFASLQFGEQRWKVVL
jgi:hypothetical protein